MKFVERNFKIDYRKAKSNSRTVPVVVSSEKPYNRGDYIEILNHHRDAIDLERDPLPLIESHDGDKVNIGLVENMRIEGGKLRGTARFGKSARAEELWADVEAGIVRSVSVGYQVLDWDSNEETSLPTMTATRWKPFECSIVSIPADESAGFYRNLNRDRNMETNSNEESKLSRSQRRAQSSSASDELERIRTINSMAERYELEDLGKRFIGNGSSVSAFQDVCLEVIGLRNVEIRVDEYGNETARRGDGSVFAPSISTGSRDTYEEFGLRQMDSIQALLASAAGLGNVDMGPYKERSQELTKLTGKKPGHGGILIPLGDMRERALTVSGSGGNSVQEDVIAGSFIDVLRAKSAVMNLGATMINGLVGDAAIPRKTSGTAGF